MTKEIYFHLGVENKERGYVPEGWYSQCQNSNGDTEYRPAEEGDDFTYWHPGGELLDGEEIYN